MGKMKSESHFSHPHPLHLISSDQTPNLSCCAGCKLKPSGMIYSCTICTTYFLHQKCFQMPTKITHPFHKDHALTLLPNPAYAAGEFNCDACTHRGDGFSYHCKPCGIDLHILCAATPLSLTSACHAHSLNLTFGSPYHTKNFVCDVCGSGGSDHWLYRCAACGFDAHLKCATAAAPRQDATTSRSVPTPPQPHGGQYLAAAAAAPPLTMQQNNAMHYPNSMMGNAAFGVPVNAMGVNGQIQNNLALQAAIMQMIQNNNAAMAQAMMAAGSGGGGYGGDRGLQQMMQLMSALNRGGLGGGGIPGLDMFGGGGLDSLQSLLGGGGLDFLGGGGLDFLGGLGGLF